MIAKLTALRYGKALEVAETLCPKNLVNIYREDNDKDSSGVAYRCEAKGVVIGYLPDLKTLRGYYNTAQSEGKRLAIKEWGQAVKSIREQFGIDYDNNGQEEWKGRVANLLYTNEKEEWLEFIEYTGQEGFTLRQIAVSFPVEVF